VLRRYSKAEALRIIQRILKNGTVFSTPHCKDRMIDRNIQMQDVVYVLKNGKITREPEIHQVTGNWIYNVEGKTLDDEILTVPVDIDEGKDTIRLLTIF
jgi:hypothetical protein